MNTYFRNQLRIIPWLIGFVIASFMSAAIAQERVSIATIDAKLDAIDGKIDSLLANSISGGGVVPVTLIQRVNPDNTVEDRSGDTTVTQRLCIGTAPCTTSDAALSNRIRQGSSEVLVVTSITAYNFGSPPPPADSYGFLNFGACSTGVFPRNYGIPAVTIDGRGTAQVTFQPGALVGNLSPTERICFTSFAQSTVLIDATMHGYLVSSP